MSEEKKEEKPASKGRRTFLATAAGTIIGAVVAGAGVWALTPKGAVEEVTKTVTAPGATVTTTAGAATQTITTTAPGATVTTTAPAVTKEVTKTVTATPTPTIGKPIKVGFMGPLTGALAYDGAEMVNGATMAIEEINAAGGVLGRKLELTTIDIEYMVPEKAFSALEKFHSDGMDLVVAGYPSNTGWELDDAAKYGYPYITEGGSILWSFKVRENPEKYYNCVATAGPPMYNAVTLPAYVQHLIDTGKYKPINNKFTVLTLDFGYSIENAEAYKGTLVYKGYEAEAPYGIGGFPKFGWELNREEKIPLPGTVEWRPILSKIRDDPPGIIINTDFITSDEAAFMQQFLEDPTESLIIMIYGPQIPEFRTLGGTATNGVIHTADQSFLPDPAGFDWMKRYIARFGHEPGLAVAPNLYDEVYLWYNAVTKLGTVDDYEKISAEILKTHYKGVCGVYRFDPVTHTVDYQLEHLGSGIIPQIVFQIQNLQQVHVFPTQFELVGEYQKPPWFK